MARRECTATVPLRSEKWLPAAVLPLTRQVVTSQVFADHYVTNGEVVTHSHGPQGMHSHGSIEIGKVAARGGAAADEAGGDLAGFRGPLRDQRRGRYSQPWPAGNAQPRFH